MDFKKILSFCFISVISLNGVSIDLNKKQQVGQLTEQLQKDSLKDLVIDCLGQVCRFLKLKDILNIALGAELQKHFFETNNGTKYIKLSFLETLIGVKKNQGKKERIRSLINFVFKTNYYPALLHFEALVGEQIKECTLLEDETFCEQLFDKKMLFHLPKDLKEDNDYCVSGNDFFRHAALVAFHKEDLELLTFLINQGDLLNSDLPDSPVQIGDEIKQFKVFEWGSLFHEAVKFNKINMLNYLVECGGSVETLELDGGFGLSLLEWAIEYGSSIETIECLLTLGVNINQDFSVLILELLIDRGNIYIIRKLLELGLDVNKQDIHGKTALHYAAGEGKFDAMAVLHDFHADQTIQDIHGETALDYLNQYYQEIRNLHL